jgi:hypothetical protein
MFQMKKSDANRRGSAGQSLTETVCGLVIVVPLALLVIDLSTIYWGYSQNLKLCADAARAAAGGPPGSISRGASQMRAEAVIKSEYPQAKFDPHTGQNGVLRVYPDCAVIEKFTGVLPDPKLGGPIDGQVTVQTTVDVVPPFLIKQFVTKGFQFTASQTYPFTYNLPPRPLESTPVK